MREYMPGTTGGTFADLGPRRETTMETNGATPWRNNLAPAAGPVLVRVDADHGYIQEPYTEAEVRAIVKQGQTRPRDLGDLANLALANDIQSREDLRAMEAWGRAEGSLSGEGSTHRHDGDESKGDPRAYERGKGGGLGTSM